MRYKYELYGLKIASELKLGTLPQTKYKEESAVKIHLQNVRRPRKNLKNTLYKPCTVANESIFFWEVPNVAKFLVKGDDTVHIQKSAKADILDVLTFFLDTILTVLLIKNEIFVFHASAIKSKGKAYIISSNSGGGKSTLAGLLFNHGYGIIEDDKCLLTWDAKKEKLYITNGIPYFELWAPQRKLLGGKKKVKRIGRVRKNIPKIRFDISEIIPKRRTPRRKNLPYTDG